MDLEILNIGAIPVTRRHHPVGVHGRCALRATHRTGRTARSCAPVTRPAPGHSLYGARDKHERCSSPCRRSGRPSRTVARIRGHLRRPSCDGDTDRFQASPAGNPHRKNSGQDSVRVCGALRPSGASPATTGPVDVQLPSRFRACCEGELASAVHTRSVWSGRKLSSPLRQLVIASSV